MKRAWLALSLAAGVSATALTQSTPSWFTYDRARPFHVRVAATESRPSIEQVKELRRALDLLAAQPGVDSARLIYVGHDFGAMYGALAAAAEAIVASAKGPHDVKWYDAEHALNAEATRDRVAWLRAQIATRFPFRTSEQHGSWRAFFGKNRAHDAGKLFRRRQFALQIRR